MLWLDRHPSVIFYVGTGKNWVGSKIRIWGEIGRSSAKVGRMDEP